MSKDEELILVKSLRSIIRDASQATLADELELDMEQPLFKDMLDASNPFYAHMNQPRDKDDDKL